MAIVGLLMILASLALAVFTDESLPIPFAGVGLVFLAAGLGNQAPTPRATNADRSARPETAEGGD